MDREDMVLQKQIEALLFASEKALSNDVLLNILAKVNNTNIDIEQIQEHILAIKNKYEDDDFAFQLVETGGGYQFLTKKEYFNLIGELNKDKFSKKLSATSMETLAIVAYKQPVTKGDIEMIRGVNADYAVQKLLEIELIQISGRNEKLPGKPLVYTTTDKLLNYLGINHINELPKIQEFNPELIPALEQIDK